MSGVQRFLSRRGRNRDPRKPRPSERPDYFDGIFTTELDPKTKHDKEEDRRIEGVLERLRNFGSGVFVESNARYALRTTHNHGDGDGAFRLLMLLQTTFDGVLRSYEPNVKLLGAVNRQNVSCYLDSLLFSMFARLDSFEAMLYDHYEEPRRKRLAGLLRLWVNMVRSGRLVTIDITKHIQDALAACGWEEATNGRQQDPSEAFTFITGQLELPLLTLKMDLYHTGKEDPNDDHKFINERLLEVAILEKPLEGRDVITLEDCLENYFNNRIEVRRHLENQRRNTMKSATSNSVNSPTKLEKESGIHIETVEISTPDVSVSSTPIAETPSTPLQSKHPLEKLRPNMSRNRTDSIFSQRKVELTGIDPEQSSPAAPHAVPERKLSTRTEVLMPAWQFFQLLPWYTDHLPTSEAQVAAHFSRKRPVLGICLKRYSYSTGGQASRRDTYVDIPLEIAVPNFVSDEHMQDDGPLAGNFRLVLQSVVCHRGVSVHSGHYVCLSRMKSSCPPIDPDSRRSSESGESDDPWVRFDDLAQERVKRIDDIHEALKTETPYLLFYQVQPKEGAEDPSHDLPTYAEATSRSLSQVHSSDEKIIRDGSPATVNPLEHTPSSTLSNDSHPGTEVTDFAPSSARHSLDLNVPRGRSSMQHDSRRGSVFVDDASVAGNASAGSVQTDNTPSIPSIPSTPNEEKTATSFLGIKMVSRSRSTRVSRGSKDHSPRGRPSSAGLSQDNSSRFNLKLTKRVSREESQPPSNTSQGSLTVQQNGEAKKSTDRPPSVVLEGNDRHSIDTAKPQGTASTSHSPSKKDKALARLEKRGKGRRGDMEDRECKVM